MKDLRSNKNPEELVRLFELAVVRLTCNNDAETLDAVLDFGKEANLEVSWNEEEDVLSGENLCFRGNPIMVASQQACFFQASFVQIKIDTNFRAILDARPFFTDMGTGYHRSGKEKRCWVPTKVRGRRNWRVRKCC